MNIWIVFELCTEKINTQPQKDAQSVLPMCRDKRDLAVLITRWVEKVEHDFGNVCDRVLNISYFFVAQLFFLFANFTLHRVVHQTLV